MCRVWVATAALVLLGLSVGAAQPRTKPTPPTPPTPPEQQVHVVAKGDTLSSLARRYRVSVTALVAANRLSSERVVLKLGQRLVIPASTAAAAPAPAPAPAPPAARVPPTRRPTTTASTTSATSATTARRPPPLTTRGPRGLELVVPDFVEAAPPFLWPVEGPVTSTYGRRRSGWHRGIDIKADRGNVIFAAAAGVVVAAGVEPRYGRVVKIEHEDGFVTVYAHNEENLVETGMRVSAGDPIGTIGRTGRATAHHLHFEIRRGTSVYNPLYLLPLPARVGQVDLTEESEEEHD